METLHNKSETNKTLKILFSAVLSLIMMILLFLKYVIQYQSASLDNPLKRGYVYSRVLTAIQNSELIGASTLLKEGFLLPEIQTDQVLAYIISQFGLVIGVLTLIALFFLAVRFIQISAVVRNEFGRNISICFSVFISVEILLSLINTTGLVYIRQYGFPFIAIGGTSFIGNCLLVGIMVSMWKAKSLIRDTIDRPYP